MHQKNQNEEFLAHFVLSQRIFVVTAPRQSFGAAFGSEGLLDAGHLGKQRRVNEILCKI